MNLNLISPQSNGNKYVVRFKEDIIIPKNSKVQLNSATLTRNGDVRIFHDSFICITSFVNERIAQGFENVYTDVLPKFRADATDNRFKFFVNIPAGIYSYDQLLVKISNGIRQAINTTPESNAPIINMADLYRAVSLDKLAVDRSDDTNFTLGFYKKSLRQGDNFVFDSTNQLAATTTHPGGGGTTIAYAKSSANTTNAKGKIFDSYANCRFKYLFANMDGDTPYHDLSKIELTPLNDLTTMMANNARICFALSSNEINDGFFGTDGAYPQDHSLRTKAGTQVQNIELSKNELAAFLTITIDCNSGAKPVVRVKVASKLAASDPDTKKNAIGSWRSSNEPILHMLTCKNITLSNGDFDIDFDDSDSFAPALATYYRIDDRNDRSVDSRNDAYRRDRLYYVIYNAGGEENLFPQPNKSIFDPENSNRILFNSIELGLDDERAYFSGAFFNTPQTALQPLAGEPAESIIKRRISAQLPFVLQLSADTLNEGFNVCFVNNISGNGVPTEDESIIMRYSLFTDNEELSSILNIPTQETFLDIVASQEQDEEPENNIFFPNHSDPNDARLVLTDRLNLNWREKGYSIYLDGLPIKNFKNNDKIRNGGFAKPILANVPAPFKDITASNFSGRDKNLVSAVYEPNNPVVSNMYNQELSTNQIGIEIRDLQTDTPSEDIKRSVINLTITPPEDFKGNLDSVEGLNVRIP